jgi:threonine dehydrogenase-like Zn-dependent dehydrogenase
MLADVFPTGLHATELAGVQSGDSVAVLGAGPVGLLAAYSAVIKGAAEVLVIDRHPDRLRLAKRIGAIPVDDSKGSAAEQVLELTKGIGVDRAANAWGTRRTTLSGGSSQAPR